MAETARNSLTLYSDMSTEKEIYSHNVLEFATAAVSFCQTLEHASELGAADFVERMLRIAPLVYLKARLLPAICLQTDDAPADQVTEQDYNFVLMGVRQLMGEHDEYVQVADPDELATELTEWKSVSEQLADVYQPVRNFLAVYEDAADWQMEAALEALEQSFTEYWGADLLDAMSRLHRLAEIFKNPEESAHE